MRERYAMGLCTLEPFKNGQGGVDTRPRYERFRMPTTELGAKRSPGTAVEGWVRLACGNVRQSEVQ